MLYPTKEVRENDSIQKTLPTLDMAGRVITIIARGMMNTEKRRATRIANQWNTRRLVEAEVR